MRGDRKVPGYPSRVDMEVLGLLVEEGFGGISKENHRRRYNPSDQRRPIDGRVRISRLIQSLCGDPDHRVRLLREVRESSGYRLSEIPVEILDELFVLARNRHLLNASLEAWISNTKAVHALDLVRRGYSTKEAAVSMDVPYDTVRSSVQEACRSYGTSGTSHMISVMYDLGYFEPRGISS